MEPSRPVVKPQANNNQALGASAARQNSINARDSGEAGPRPMRIGAYALDDGRRSAINAEELLGSKAKLSDEMANLISSDHRLI